MIMWHCFNELIFKVKYKYVPCTMINDVSEIKLSIDKEEILLFYFAYSVPFYFSSLYDDTSREYKSSS